MKNYFADFYLVSSEGYGMEKPRKCYRIKRLKGAQRDDYLLIKIDPPLIGQKYGLGGRDIDKVIIATRHKGDSLFPIKEWPVFIHVARILIDDLEDRETVVDNEFEEIGWAELYETEEAARGKVV